MIKISWFIKITIKVTKNPHTLYINFLNIKLAILSHILKLVP